ncbi:MAG: DUF3352 domain-containing protein [Cyanobacteria bacterium J06626_4]
MIFVKKPPLIVTIGTALVLVSAGVLTYVGLRWRLTRAQGLPVGVRAVPQAAVAAVTLSTDTEQWQQLRQFGNPETQATFDGQLAEWRDRWLTQYDISYAEDIAPWIDAEVTIAWVPEPESVTGNESGTVSLGEQGRLLLVPIADPEAAQISAESLPLAAAAGEPTEYRGVTLTPLTPTSGNENEALLIGLLGTQLIMVAEDENVAQQAIDAYKGGKNLADLAGYRRSFEHIGVPQAFSKVYLNVPAAAQLLAQSAQPALPTALLNSFQDSRGLAATMTLQSQGLQIASTSWFGPDSDRAYVDTNVPAQLPEYLPNDTLVMASGGNFQQFWQDLSDRQNWGALTALNPDNLALALQGSTGLTLEDDLLPWLGGEFALALMPPPSADSEAEATPTLPNPSLVVLAQVSDRPQAEQTFARLDEVVENRYRFTLTEEPAEDVERVRWTSPFESTMLARGWLESNIAFLTVGPKTDELIVPQPRRSLARSPLFQLTTGGAPYPNNGYFYVNLAALSQTENNLFLPDLSIENQGLLKAMQAIGVTATVLDEQRLRYDLYLALKRGNRPGPLPSSASEPEAPEAEPSESSPTEESPPEGEPPAEADPAAPEAEAESTE